MVLAKVGPSKGATSGGFSVCFNLGVAHYEGTEGALCSPGPSVPDIMVQIPPSTCQRPVGLSFLSARLSFLTVPSESLIS
jgi:hypothetical protein